MPATGKFADEGQEGFSTVDPTYLLLQLQQNIMIGGNLNCVLSTAD